MKKEFEGLKEKKDKELKERRVKYALGEIKDEIETCMIEEIDLMDYPPELIETMASLHQQLEALSLESSGNY
jgi:hypothetical protein